MSFWLEASGLKLEAGSFVIPGCGPVEIHNPNTLSRHSPRSDSRHVPPQHDPASCRRVYGALVRGEFTVHGEAAGGRLTVMTRAMARVRVKARAMARIRLKSMG